MSAIDVIDALEDMLDARDQIPENVRKIYEARDDLCESSIGRRYLAAKDRLKKELENLIRSHD